jgi:hypothetical protein
VGAEGLRDENVVPGATNRVYVKVHNRGRQDALNVAVRAFWADCPVGIPELPANFWTGFPANTVGAGAWNAVAPHVVVPKIEAGQAQVVGFELAAPASVSDNLCLLAATSVTGDALATTERNVADLVLGQVKCAVRNVVSVTPRTRAGARLRALRANLWGVRGGGDYVLAVADASDPFVIGVVLSTPLSTLAKSANVPQLAISADRVADLAALTARFPGLAGALDTSVAFVPPTRGRWLDGVHLGVASPEPVVLFVEHNPRRGRWSLIQETGDGQPVGGLTLTSGY